MADTIYLLTGSNMGDREKNLHHALEKIEALPGLELVAVSGIYLSEAAEMTGENPSFMNQVIMADYIYPPSELLGELEAIERKMGRLDKGKKKPRLIDIDILLFGDKVIETTMLVIPHSQLLKRPFAMIPLLQISPEIVHPVKNKPVSSFVKKADRDKVALFKDYVSRNV